MTKERRAMKTPPTTPVDEDARRLAYDREEAALRSMLELRQEINARVRRRPTEVEAAGLREVYVGEFPEGAVSYERWVNEVERYAAEHGVGSLVRAAVLLSVESRSNEGVANAVNILMAQRDTANDAAEVAYQAGVNAAFDSVGEHVIRTALAANHASSPEQFLCGPCRFGWRLFHNMRIPPEEFGRRLMAKHRDGPLAEKFPATPRTVN